MEQSGIKCFRRSDGVVCPACNGGRVVKNGKTSAQKQQYFCRDCGKRFISHYTYRAYQSSTNDQIIRLLKEGVGMRGIARQLAVVYPSQHALQTPHTLLGEVSRLRPCGVRSPDRFGERAANWVI